MCGVTGMIEVVQCYAARWMGAMKKEIVTFSRRRFCSEGIGALLGGCDGELCSPCPFGDSLGIVWPLPFACWYFKMRHCAGVSWFEDVMMSFVFAAPFLTFDEPFQDGFLVYVAGEGGCCGLFMEKHGLVVCGFGHACVSLTLGAAWRRD